MKERVPEISLTPTSIVRLSKAEVFAVLEERINNWDPRITPLTMDYFRDSIERLYSQKQ